MHGYLTFSEDGELLVPFRTWRNNNTAQATDTLTELFNFNIPHRWSIAPLYQAILNEETHVKDIHYMTTLSGYVHWKLFGEKVLGIGDASGMFPIDEKTGDFSQTFLKQFAHLETVTKYPWDVKEILLKVLKAGDYAGSLTDIGEKLIDKSGQLQAGSTMASPEGDGGTGMVCTNSVHKKTGNISVGTSAFSMLVLDEPLKKVYRDIDMVTTPDGTPVAMVHTNNCASDIDAWVSLFMDFSKQLGLNLSPGQLYELLFTSTNEADLDAGGLMNFNYLSGEHITNVSAGRPLFVRAPNSKFTLANFIQVQLYSAFASLKIGMDFLKNEEDIKMDMLIAHGGLFNTPVITQQILANALNIPIKVLSTAGEGGAWGMALKIKI
jgi:sugar (pentulose or hexulose) kinase